MVLGTSAAALVTSVGGDLTLRSCAAAGITDSGTVTVGGNLIATTDDNDGVIDMGTLAVTGTITLVTHGNGAATVINDIGLTFAASTVGGALTATATLGNITQGSGDLDITGVAKFIAGATGSHIIIDG